MYVIQSSKAPACFESKRYASANEAEAALIESGYREVNHPAGRVFVKASKLSNSRSICRVVEYTLGQAQHESHDLSEFGA
jgi:hypothetical protein